MIDNKKYKNVDKINIICDNCGKKYETSFFYEKKGIKKYGKDLCRSCRQKEQYKLGLRNKQIEICKKNADNQRGKTFEELYGVEKAIKLKQIYSKNSSGNNNSMFGKHHSIETKNKLSDFRKGKSLEDICGIEKATELKQKLSIRFTGEGNNMFGKPSPQGSGNGWSGWYKEFYFRSLLELSFLVQYDDLNNLKNAEYIKIPYVCNNVTKTYLPDFINEKNKILFEIKPNNLINSEINKLKFKAGFDYCKKNNLSYKILTETDIHKLNTEEINILYINKEISFIDRYEEKYKKEFLK